MCFLCQEAAQALIYAGMAGSKLDGIQDKVNEYLDRVQALHNAGMFKERLHGVTLKYIYILLLLLSAALHHSHEEDGVQTF